MRGGGTGGEERQDRKGKNGVCVWVGRGGGETARERRERKGE